MKNKIIILLVLICIFSSSNFVSAQTQPDPQLESVNKQIDELIKNAPVRSTWSDTFVEEKTNDSRILGYILAGIIVTILAGNGLYNFTRPQNIEERRRRREQGRIIREENIKMAKEERERKLQERLEEQQRIKEEALQRNSDFMNKIRQTPRYERWKEEVKEKCGNKCQIDKSHANRYTEVHHLVSLHAILKQNNIISIEGALGCRTLWDTDNGIVLCKECHDQMESSIKRQALMLEDN